MTAFISANPNIAETEPPAKTFWVGVRDNDCYVAAPARGLAAHEVVEWVTEWLSEDQSGFEFVFGEES